MAAIAAGSMLWVRRAWHEVEVHVGFRPARVYAGEAVELSIRVSNEKRMPLPVVRLAIALPPGLTPAVADRRSTLRGFRRTLRIPGRSEVVISLPIRATGRGEYRLERVSLEISDPFDLAPLGREFRPDADLLVMPEPRIQVPVDVLRRLPFGAPARAAQIFEERERFAGVRPYQPGDPLNRIHWRLTGHSGELQTKLFEPTRSADVLLVLDLALGEPFWDAVFPEVAEDTIGWASFLARRAFLGGWRVGLVANTHLRRGRGPLRVPASSARGHEAALFAALARMPNEPTSDLGMVLREVGRTLGRWTTVVVLAPKPGPALTREMTVLRRRGISLIELSPLDARLSGIGA